MRVKEECKLERIGSHFVITRRKAEGKYSILFALNETGAFLWNELLKGYGEEELVKALCTEYEALPEEEDQMRKDVAEFLVQLRTMNVLKQAGD